MNSFNPRRISPDVAYPCERFPPDADGRKLDLMAEMGVLVQLVHDALVHAHLPADRGAIAALCMEGMNGVVCFAGTISGAKLLFVTLWQRPECGMHQVMINSQRFTFTESTRGDVLALIARQLAL
jgi:hypothetical protein